MNSESNNETTQFEQLQKRYLGSVPSKLDKLDSAWQAITAGDWSKPAVDQLKQEVHRIAGSSGSYGFHALSEAAIDLENELLRWYQNPDDAALRHSIEQGHTKFVAKLEQLAQAGARDISAHPVLSGSRQKNKGLVFLVEDDVDVGAGQPTGLGIPDVALDPDLRPQLPLGVDLRAHPGLQLDRCPSDLDGFCIPAAFHSSTVMRMCLRMSARRPSSTAARFAPACGLSTFAVTRFMSTSPL